jgi:hypothetical protein
VELERLNERQLIDKAKKSMENMQDLIHELRDFKKEFTGTELNPEAGFFNEMRAFKHETKCEIKELNEKVTDLQKFQLQQKTGWSLGKWLIGTSLGAFLLSQLTNLQHYIKDLFR